MVMDPGDHIRQTQNLLNIVDHPLIFANRQLQSEVLWGAATQMVKAVAKTHNIPNRSHRDLFLAVRQIANSIAQDRRLIREFARIDDLHENFYEGEMSAEEVAQSRAVTLRFVSKMRRLQGSR